MREDLSMHGNQITKVSTVFTCGYVSENIIEGNCVIIADATLKLHCWHGLSDISVMLERNKRN